MTYLLFPGRHLLNTAFQARYLRAALQTPLQQLDYLDSARPNSASPINHVVFAITSANQQQSRYNPIPFHVRAISVDRFARSLAQAQGVEFNYRIVGVPHYPPTPRFARIILREIEEQTEGHLRLTPDNCVVLSSTPGVFNLFRELGFAILPAEHGLNTETPTQLLQQIVAAGEQWREQPDLRRKVAASTIDVWCDFPDVPRRILRLWRDPLLNDQGTLSATRDYGSYALGMGNNDIINLKYEDIKEAIVPGKIVDEGCADGALLQRLAADFPDSDLIGIEITGEFIARARERQRAGQFGETFVHFHQRDLIQPIFEPDSIDTTLSNSTIHELWSYGGGAATVHDYLRQKYAQTRPGGRLIIRDVVGPDDKEQEVYLRLEHRDGANDDIYATFDDPRELAAHLAGLSTYARFKRFARDFLAAKRRASGDPSEFAFDYRESVIRGSRSAILSLRYAVEFMSKKDYVNNWLSEMEEEFAFWSFDEWKAALSAAGFYILENPNAPHRGSRTYTNPWIVANRWQDKVELYHRIEGRLQPMPYPPTNVVLVGEKRLEIGD